MASLDLLEKKESTLNILAIEKSNRKFADDLENFAERGQIKNIRNKGTILAFEIISGKDEYLNSIGSIVTDKALSKGVYIRPLGNTVYIMPPYCITEEELSKIFRTIIEILEEVNA